MLRADGFRLFRLVVSGAKSRDPVKVRQMAERKGLILDFDKRNPSQPFRYRTPRKDVVEIEQLQNVSGAFAGCPPEQPDFFERFQAGEPWAGIVKTASA